MGPKKDSPVQFVGTALPDLKVSDDWESRTVSQHLQETFFKGPSVAWEDFVEEVKQLLEKARNDKTPRDVDYPHEDQRELKYLHPRFESLTCGDEDMLVARYNNNTIEPALLAFEQLCFASSKGKKTDIHAGGSYISNLEIEDAVEVYPKELTNAHEPPDVVIRNRYFMPRVVGELKTCCGVKDLERERQGFMEGDERGLFSRMLAQVALNMQAYRAPYGFFSNYEETIVCKQEFDPAMDRYVMHHSLVISSKWFDKDTTSFNDAQDYLPRTTKDAQAEPITTRQAMLYLVIKTAGLGGPNPGMKDNPNRDADWLGFPAEVGENENHGQSSEQEHGAHGYISNSPSWPHSVHSLATSPKYISVRSRTRSSRTTSNDADRNE